MHNNILENLNEPQLKAVTAEDGPLLILAGAGSGKTKALTHRIAYLLQTKQIWPNQILAMTFSNKAAKEIQDRVISLLGPSAHSVWIGTFHSVCCRILKQEIERLGFKKDFVIYDDQDQTACIKALIKDMNLPDSVFTPDKIKYKINAFRNQCIGPDDIEPQFGNIYEKKLKAFFTEYQKRLKAYNAVDFGNLIFHIYTLLKTNKLFRDQYQNKWKYVLIDEFQDTNKIQYEIVKYLSISHNNLNAVGDDDQSIYRWRGATVENIFNLPRDFKNTQIIKLEQNYRSTQSIIAAAHSVVVNNSARMEKNLWTSNENGERIQIIYTDDEQTEATQVRQTIQSYILQGKNLNDFAIFYRTNAQSRLFEEELTRYQIPYVLVGGFRFYERKEIKDLLSYLKFIVNPYDSISFKRMISVPPRGIGAKTLEKIQLIVQDNSMNFIEALNYLTREKILKGKAAKSISSLTKQIEALKKRMENEPIPSIVRDFISEISFPDYLRSLDQHEQETRMENVNEFINSIYDYFESFPKDNLSDFLDRISLVNDTDRMKDHEEKVTLMTLHCAKGLEFDTVFMAGMEDGLFPHSRSMDSEEEFEEERRLCYVGMTRAMKNLYMLSCRKRKIFGITKYVRPSVFLNEINNEYTEKTVNVSEYF
ncbi:MAG: UvrD-helicase domain-containing protein [Pseudomonadota bacterium]